MRRISVELSRGNEYRRDPVRDTGGDEGNHSQVGNRVRVDLERL